MASISSTSSGSAQTIAALKKQLQTITKEIAEETNSKDDAKTKAEEITSLQLQEQMIQMQIQQAEKPQQAQPKAAAPATAASSSAASGTGRTHPHHHGKKAGAAGDGTDDTSASIAGTPRDTSPADDAIGQQLNVLA